MKKADLFFPVLSTVFAGAYWIASLSYPPKSAFFPRAVIVALLFFVAIYLIKEFVKNKKGPSLSKNPAKPLGEKLQSIQFRRAFVLCSGIFLYYIIARPLGFILTNFVILGALMRILGANWRRTLVLTVVITILLHFFFREYLHAPFPRGPGEWFYYWIKHTYFS